MTTISFNNVNPDSNTGGNSFGSRLIKELKNRNYEISFDDKNIDINLIFIEPYQQWDQTKPVIVRLDGIWFKPEDFKAGKNDRIKYVYELADHVIIQSQFDKEMIEKWFGKRENIHIIGNGIDFDYVNNIVPSNNDIFKYPNKVFVCSAMWHPQKRLEDNIRLFQKIRNGRRNYYLIVLGSIGYNVKLSVQETENVITVGLLSHEDCISIYKRCEYMIHLGFLDHFANVLVESLASGCPVIHTDSGGTPEVVQNNGIIIPEKQKYDYSLINYDEPWELNYSDFSLPNKKINVSNIEHLNIKQIADQYEKVFSLCLNKKN